MAPGPAHILALKQSPRSCRQSPPEFDPSPWLPPFLRPSTTPSRGYRPLIGHAIDFSNSRSRSLPEAILGHWTAGAPGRSASRKITVLLDESGQRRLEDLPGMGPGQETGIRSYYPNFDRSLNHSIGPFPASSTLAPASSIHRPPEPSDSASPSSSQGSRWHRQQENVLWSFPFIYLPDGHFLYRWAISPEAISGASLMDRPVLPDGSAH
jgi:hypothetical protein